MRWVLVTPQIDALLDGHVRFGEFPNHYCEKLIGVFSAGYRITVSRKITKLKPDVEKLEGHDEVWVLCPRIPNPGWRILGRLYDKGIFIALRAWDKRDLAGNYDKAAEEVIEDWKELFGLQPTHRANSLEDYLGGLVKDVDDVA